MSRLDSFIRRLQAQRACLDLAMSMIGAVDGPVLELGLGNGRTYDHLRTRLVGRPIYVFDRRIAAHPDCIPEPGLFIEGDILATLAGASARLPGPAALAHCDIGTGDAAANAALARAVAPLIDRLMAEGGLIVSDQRMEAPGWRPVPLPAGIVDGRYHIRLVERSSRRPAARSKAGTNEEGAGRAARPWRPGSGAYLKP